MKRLVLLPTVAPMLAVASPAHAGSVTYTAQTNGTGTLGQTAFNNAQITITYTGNTDDINSAGQVFQISKGKATVTVAGIGTATFTDPMAVTDVQFQNQGGITDLSNQSDVLNVLNSAFGSYQLNTSIGPISGTALNESDISFPTSRGGLLIGLTGENASFTAAVAAGPIVPEPTTITLFGVAFLGMACRGWQSTRKV